jgi:hypothetical protein
MQFIGSFNTFNPLNGYFSRPYSELTKSVVNLKSDGIHFPLILDWMAGRAQEIIKERNLEEIENALNTINYLFYLVEEENRPKISSNDPIELLVREFSNPLPIELFTPARMLITQVSKFSIDDSELVKNGRWEEYFAILALALLGDIHRFYQSKEDISVEIAAFAAEAMEALTIAESPGLSAPVMDPGLQEQSLRNQENAIKGHAELNALKSQFQTWLLKEYLPDMGGKPFIKRDAARVFEKRIKGGEIATECSVDLGAQVVLVRTLADSLAKDPRFQNI